MELTQLRTLREVAETLNFTRAAERLGLTQSAVSHQIKSLEAELGEPLFVRAKRGVLLSEGGRAALEHAIRILEEVETLRVRLPGAGHAPSGRVRAAAATPALVHLFPGLFESFLKSHPRLQLTFPPPVSTHHTAAGILHGAAEAG